MTRFAVFATLFVGLAYLVIRIDAGDNYHAKNFCKDSAFVAAMKGGRKHMLSAGGTTWRLFIECEDCNPLEYKCDEGKRFKSCKCKKGKAEDGDCDEEKVIDADDCKLLRQGSVSYLVSCRGKSLPD